MVDVTYPGLFGQVRRTFENLDRAHQWARQVGVFSIATFGGEKEVEMRLKIGEIAVGAVRSVNASRESEPV